MTDVFTDYVRRLQDEDDPPDQPCFDEALEHLRARLVTEMRKRGLWTAPPAYLGVQAQCARPSLEKEDGECRQ